MKTIPVYRLKHYGNGIDEAILNDFSNGEAAVKRQGKQLKVSHKSDILKKYELVFSFEGLISVGGLKVADPSFKRHQTPTYAHSYLEVAERHCKKIHKLNKSLNFARRVCRVKPFTTVIDFVKQRNGLEL